MKDKLKKDIELYTNAYSIYHTFINEEYRYIKDNENIGVSEGDYVIDAGGCWGDTALYFADIVGEKAKVFTFEFIPSNLEIMDKNLSLNKELKKRITIVKNPIHSESKKKMFYVDYGPGSKVEFNKNELYDGTKCDGEIETISIDDFVSNNNVEKVNFIKMDIEGAEYDALIGAKETIKKYSPKLAISIYHNKEHFDNIPKLIKEMNPKYKLFLKYCTIHAEETVLFTKID